MKESLLQTAQQMTIEILLDDPLRQEPHYTSSLSFSHLYTSSISPFITSFSQVFTEHLLCTSYQMKWCINKPSSFSYGANGQFNFNMAPVFNFLLGYITLSLFLMVFVLLDLEQLFLTLRMFRNTFPSLLKLIPFLPWNKLHRYIDTYTISKEST